MCVHFGSILTSEAVHHVLLSVLCAMKDKVCTKVIKTKKKINMSNIVEMFILTTIISHLWIFDISYDVVRRFLGEGIPILYTYIVKNSRVFLFCFVKNVWYKHIYIYINIKLHWKPDSKFEIMLHNNHLLQNSRG